MTVFEKFDEKYRPTTFKDFAGDKETIRSIKDEVDKGVGCRHFLFYGPAGTGKSSMAFVVLRYMFRELIKAKESIRTKYIRTNASNVLRIDYLREVLIPFAESAGEKRGLKLLILDEFDGTSDTVQDAFKDFAEKYGKYLKIILITNYRHKIRKPVIDRCFSIEFPPISAEGMLERLKYICEQENIEASEKLLLRIGNLSEGSVRNALIQYLQSLEKYRGKGPIPDDIKLGEVSREKLEKTAITITRGSLNGKVVESIQYFKKILQTFNMKSVIEGMVKFITYYKKYPNLMKSDVFIILAEADNLINTGSSNEVVLSFIVGKLNRLGLRYSNKNKK